MLTISKGEANQRLDELQDHVSLYGWRPMQIPGWKWRVHHNGSQHVGSIADKDEVVHARFTHPAYHRCESITRGYAECYDAQYRAGIRHV